MPRHLSVLLIRTVFSCMVGIEGKLSNLGFTHKLRNNPGLNHISAARIEGTFDCRGTCREPNFNKQKIRGKKKKEMKKKKKERKKKKEKKTEKKK